MTDRYVSEQAERRVHRFGRLGYLTYGVVQLVLAVLTFQLAWGSPPQDASTSGAIQTMAQQPAGHVLVWVVAAGMAVLALWQGYVAWAMNDGVWASTSAAATAVTYAVVAGLAVRFAVGGSGGGGGDTGEQAAATLFDLPGGRWIVAALGLAVAGAGVRQAVRVRTVDSSTTSKPVRRRVAPAPGCSGWAGWATWRKGSRSSLSGACSSPQRRPGTQTRRADSTRL